ncbi:MAG: ATP-binding protein [Deltaproteobacteria bacterium]|jgi:hypothetical protein|nr:ATP-binding protein [Deltaproteobacteria bacterium]
MADLKNIPIGIAGFPTIRQNNCIYADKTKLLRQLVKIPVPYFLSRPRRFGKSLLVSTLKAILKGGDNKKLFEGLWIHDHSDYEWTPSPVIHLSMNSVSTFSLDKLECSLISKLMDVAEAENITIGRNQPSAYFEALINKLNDKYDRNVAVLIDEYDAPILSKITRPDLANGIREVLSNFYGVLKSAEENRGFTFITGVTKFTKASIFSTLNNLLDLTLDPEYASICGFTLKEFDSLFADRLPLALAEAKSKGDLEPDATEEDLKNKILDWYDGYSWDGQTRVLNPWSVLNFFERYEFSEYWFDSGGTSFLADFIKERKINLASFNSRDFLTDSLNTIDVGANFSPTTLLFQAGYLTVGRTEKIGEKKKKFYLRFPNLDVQAALSSLWLFLDSPIEAPLLLKRQAQTVLETLIQRRADDFQKTFASFLAAVPWQIKLGYEAYYNTVFLWAMSMADQTWACQDSAGDGQFDVHINTRDGNDYIIEMKYVREKEKGRKLSKEEIRIKKAEAAKEAMTQIEDKKYALKFQGQGNKIYKTALIIAGRNDVLVIFEEAKNWTLELDPSKNYYGVQEV